MNDGYKEVRLGPKKVDIPEEWEVTSIGDIGDVKGGKRLPKGHSYADEKTEYPYLRVVDFNNGGIDEKELLYLNKETYEKLNRYKITKIDVFISIAGTIGLIGIIPPKLDGSILTENAAKICEINNDIDKKYLYFFLSSFFGQNEIDRYSSITSQPKLALYRTKKILVFKPPLPEQRRIADILSTVDDAIQKTDDVIEKAERLKKGLMQDLLTKGIGHDEFKEVQIGPRFIKIPKEWGIKNLQPSNGIVRKVTDGSHYSPPQIEDGEYLYATVTNFSNRGIDYKTCNKINEDEYLKMVEGGNEPQKGDVLFSKDGTIGITDVYNDEEDVVLLSSIAIIRPMQNQVNPTYLKYFLSSKEIEHQIRSFKSGTAIRRVVLRDIKKFKIPIPPPPEQHRIADILSNIDKKIKEEKSYKEKLQHLKKGLMQDLLTGKVRVNT